MTRTRQCYAVDLRDDADAVESYKQWHRPGGPPAAVTHSLREAGIAELEIYLIGTRLFMIIDVEGHYSVSAKATADAGDAEVQAWNIMMNALQREVSCDRSGDAASGKWRLMECVYSLATQP